MKHHVRKVVIGEAKDSTSTGGERCQGVSKFLQGGGAADSIVWVGNVGPFGVNGKEDRGYAHVFPENDHREESKAARRWYMGDAGGRRYTRGSGTLLQIKTLTSYQSYFFSVYSLLLPLLPKTRAQNRLQYPRNLDKFLYYSQV